MNEKSTKLNIVKRPEAQSQPTVDLKEADELSRLRSLLFESETQRLNTLSNRLDDQENFAREISTCLPEAILLKAGKDKEKLVTSLMPTVESIVHESAQRDPTTLAKALFPAIGPAIRKSIAESFRAMIQSLNETLNHSLSWRGVKWRFEALRTGKSFAEVVLLNSLVYRVEQVFLIHGETGLVLAHVVAQDVAHQDADMVSGMLTAIRDFVKDSFNPGDEDSLDTMRVGELTVVIEQGSQATLAAVIRGTPPVELGQQFRDVLDVVHLEKFDDLRAYAGDAAPFESVVPRLEDCLQTRYQEKQDKSFPFFKLIACVVLLALCAGGYFLVQKYARWNELVLALNAEPGLVVIDESMKFTTYHVRGLRDPLARDPAQIVRASRVNPETVRLEFEPYQDLSHDFVAKRATAILQAPDSVSTHLEHGVLSLTGVASLAWITTARPIAHAIAGVRQVNFDVKPPPTEVDPQDALWENFIKVLQGTPGLAVLHHTKNKNTFHVTGMRDPLAQDPAQLLVRSDMDKARVNMNWEVFQSLAPSIVLARAKEKLAPPESVRLSFENGQLTAKGEATHAWMTQAKNIAESIAGVNKYNDNTLMDVDVNKLELLAQSIDNVTLHFIFGKNTLAEGQEIVLDRITQRILNYQELALRLNRNSYIEIYGHADQIGNARANLKLSQNRAQGIKAHLVSKGVAPSLLFTSGKGHASPVIKTTDQDIAQLNRRVDFHVVFVEATPNADVSKTPGTQ